MPAGRVLVEEGTIGREFFLIVEGEASVRRNGRDAWPRSGRVSTSASSPCSTGAPGRRR